jgi:hypothetical protein
MKFELKITLKDMLKALLIPGTNESRIVEAKRYEPAPWEKTVGTIQGLVVVMGRLAKHKYA